MEEFSKTTERHRLEKNIAEAEEALRKIRCNEEEVMDEGARPFVARVNEIYNELQHDDLSPEQEQELKREKSELRGQPLYIKLTSVRKLQWDAYWQLLKARRELEEFLGEEAPSIEPTTPLTTSTATSKFFSSLISQVLAHIALCMVDTVYGRYIIKYYIQLLSALQGILRLALVLEQ